MKIAGGVIAIVVGVIQFIFSGIAVLFTEGVSAVAEGVSAVADPAGVEQAQNRIAELEAQGASQAEIEAARSALDMLDANVDTAVNVDAAVTLVGAAVALSWIFLLIGLATFVLGIMVLSMRSQPVGVALAAVGVVAVVIALVLGGGLGSLVWSGLIVLAGVFGWLGAKPQTATA